jgi:hypothetical protein
MKKKRTPQKPSVDSVQVPQERMSEYTLVKSIQDLTGESSSTIQREEGDPDPSTTPSKTHKTRVFFQSDRSMTSATQVGDSYSKPARRLRDKDLQSLAAMDPDIGAIINTRVSQSTAFGDKSDSQFDKGIRMLDPQAPKEEDYANPELYAAEMKRRSAIKDAILDWISNCGDNNPSTLDDIYEDSDNTLKFCSLKAYIQAQTRNLLTFGRMYRQNIRDQEGDLLIFRPAPAEGMEPVRPGHKVYLSRSEANNEDSLVAVENYNQIPDGKKPIAWVQNLDGRQVAFFTERDLHVSFYQTQAMIDLCGYPLAPIEFAIYLVYMHQHSLQYLRNQFTKGMLNRSIITISTTDPDVELSPEDMANFKREMQNMAMRTENTSSVPVLSGPIKVDVRPLDLGPKDLEWLQLEQNVRRCLCSAFQIAPDEVGFGLLGDPGRTLGDSGKDNDLIQGEERGLRILVDIILDDLNKAMYDKFPDAKTMGLRLIAVGLGSETRSGMLARLQTEAQLTATMNDLYSQSEKNITMKYGGNVPLSSVWHQNVVKYMHYGKFIEEFFGEKDASKNPAYDFLVDPGMNTAYQSLKTGGQNAMAAQNQKAVAQVQQATQQGATPQNESQGPEKPLAEHYDRQEKLNKSLLESWLNLNS